MSLKKPFSLFILVLFCLSCEDSRIDCSAVSCAGPAGLSFDVLLNGENVFSSETFTIDGVRLTGANSTDFALSLFSIDSATSDPILFMDFHSFTFRARDYELFLDFGNDFSVKLDLQTELSSTDGCCGGIPFFTGIQINDVEQNLPERFDDPSFTLNLN